MAWFDALIRPELREIAPYASARAAAGQAPSIAVDANESPWPPFGPLAAHANLHRYPEQQPRDLIARLAEVWNVPAAGIFLGRGSDEGIDLLIRLLCAAGKDQILVCPPTFGMYAFYAAVQGAEVKRVPLAADGQLDVAGCLKACTAATKLIFIPAPNAPMGHAMRAADIRALCEARSGRGFVVVDEAYAAFSSDPAGFAPTLAEIPNLILLRTLSKANALAGERIGAVIAEPALIGRLRAVASPYPLTQTSIRAALDALTPNGLVEVAERRRLLIAERERMRALLAASPRVREVFPSEANFLLVRVDSAAAVMDLLRAHGILARSRHEDVPETVRLSIAAPAENDLILKVLGVEPAAAPAPARIVSVRRRTKETDISVTVNLDAPSFLSVATGIGFFDHMIAQLATHGGFGLALRCEGDLHIDEHHTVEDCALALGEALKKALGDKRGIGRYGFHAPLDEALAQVAIDLSGRPYFVFTGAFPASAVGGLSTEMVPHFFRSFATALGAALHLSVTGENTHHMVEAAFKATARALRDALRREGGGIPSSKGTL